MINISGRVLRVQNSYGTLMKNHLAPSDYYLFRNLKQFLRGKRFSSNEEAIAAVEQYFAELPENHYRDGIKLLEDRWNKCVQVEGDYIE